MADDAHGEDGRRGTRSGLDDGLDQSRCWGGPQGLVLARVKVARVVDEDPVLDRRTKTEDEKAWYVRINGARTPRRARW